MCVGCVCVRRYVCMCVCMYVFLNIFMYLCSHVHTYVYICLNFYLSISVCLHVCIYVFHKTLVKNWILIIYDILLFFVSLHLACLDPGEDGLVVVEGLRVRPEGRDLGLEVDELGEDLDVVLVDLFVALCLHHTTSSVYEQGVRKRLQTFIFAYNIYANYRLIQNHCTIFFPFDISSMDYW